MLARISFFALGASLLFVMIVPVFSLAISSSPSALAEGLRHPLVRPALWLSLKTTMFSLAIVVICGAPLAWFLAHTRLRLRRVLQVLVELPIVIPPAVIGIALLLSFGRNGIFGAALGALGWSLPFTPFAVVLAQVVVAAPFFVQSATAGFRRVDQDLLLVARTLGASETGAFFRVALPAALPALISGAAMAWARAMGEFGATLLFAGNMPGRTQTMPLAIYTALETDVQVAQAIALLLSFAGFLALLMLRLTPLLWRARTL